MVNSICFYCIPLLLTLNIMLTVLLSNLLEEKEPGSSLPQPWRRGAEMLTGHFIFVQRFTWWPFWGGTEILHSAGRTKMAARRISPRASCSILIVYYIIIFYNRSNFEGVKQLCRRLVGREYFNNEQLAATAKCILY